MKIFFLLVLLSNIIFFLWEFNSARRYIDITPKNDEIKQIFLLSELPAKETEAILVVANNKPTSIESIESLVLDRKKLALEPSPSQLIESVQLTKDDVKLLDNSESENEQYVQIVELEKSTVELEEAEEVGEVVTKQPDIVKEIITPSVQTGELESIQTAELDSTLEGDENKLSDIKQDIPLDTVDTVETVENKLLKEEGKESAVDLQMEKQLFCYQAGPFLDEKALNDWAMTNAQKASSVTHLNKDVQTATTFLVYYPKSESYEQSKRNIQMLKRKGISDFWLFRKGELKGAISLGLFAKESRALVLQKKFSKTGLKVEIMPRYKTASVWYAKIYSDTKLTEQSMRISEKQEFSVCDSI